MIETIFLNLFNIETMFNRQNFSVFWGITCMVFLCLLAVVASAQTTTTTLIKTLPKSDTIFVGADMVDRLELIETLEKFARIEVAIETTMDESTTAQYRKNGYFGIFGVSVVSVGTWNPSGDVYNSSVNLRKADIHLTIKGVDVEYKRSYLLYVPQGQIVVRNQAPHITPITAP